MDFTNMGAAPSLPVQPRGKDETDFPNVGAAPSPPSKVMTSLASSNPLPYQKSFLHFKQMPSFNPLSSVWQQIPKIIQIRQY